MQANTPYIMIRELKFWTFSVPNDAGYKIHPKTLKKTWEWVAKMPLEK